MATTEKGHAKNVANFSKLILASARDSLQSTMASARVSLLVRV